MTERSGLAQDSTSRAGNHDVYAAIGTKVREARHDRKLSLEELAEMSGLTPAFLGQIERHDRKLSVAALAKVAQALQLSPNDLMDHSCRPRQVSWEDRIAILLHRQPDERKMLIFKMLKSFLRSLRH